MRKATLIFILLVFIGSIMLVNFFGLEYKSYDKTQKVTEIQISNVTVSGGLKVTSSAMTVDKKTGENYYRIDIQYEKNYKYKTGKDQIVMVTPHVMPDNATYKDLKVDGDKSDAYELNTETPIPTVIYKDIKTDSRLSTYKFTLTNEESALQLKVIIYTTFVDSIA